jgi:hypothetical protein
MPKEPKKVVTLLEFSKRTGASYSTIVNARKKGLLSPDFVDNSGRALFDPDRLKEESISCAPF